MRQRLTLRVDSRRENPSMHSLTVSPTAIRWARNQLNMERAPQIPGVAIPQEPSWTSKRWARGPI